MSSGSRDHGQHDSELVHLYALQALPSSEVSGVEAQISGCADCRQELEALRPVIDAFVSWPVDVLRPSPSLWERLAARIAPEAAAEPAVSAPRTWAEPDWREVAAGLSCKVLASDTETDRVTLLVRLAAGTDYPPHRHGGVEELHLLHGELIVNERKLYPGDYLRSEAGTADHRVWSETGCTCVLITSSRDAIL
jgi:hypothetical protein